MTPIIRTEHAREDAITARRAELMTVKEYAAFVRQHEWSIYRRIRLGTQRGVVRVGGTIRIDIVAAEGRNA